MSCFKNESMPVKLAFMRKSIDENFYFEDILLVRGCTCDVIQLSIMYCANHVPVQPNFRRYNFYFLPDQAKTHLDHFNVLDELWCEISFKSDNG